MAGSRLSLPLSGTGDAVHYRYDAARRPVGTIFPDPDGAGPLKRRAEQVHYDFSGRQTVTRRGTVDGITQTDWTGFQTLETATRWFDSLGRVSAVSLAGADGVSRARTEMSYDLAGRPVCTAVRVVDPPLNAPAEPACEAREAADGTRDRIGRRFYDPAGQLVSVWTGWDTIGARREAAYSYTGNGQVQLLTDAEDNRTSFAYDLHDRLFRTRYPVEGKGERLTASNDYEELGYDAAGNVTSRKLRDNDDTNAADDPVIFYAYDDLGRMVLKDLPGTEPDTTYAYDNLGQLKTASQPGHALGFVYDALGRLRIEGGPRGNVLSAYDAAGRRTRLTWPDGFHVDYDYNQDGSLRRIRENGETSGAGVLATFGYDALGRRSSITRGNGTVTNYGYDPVSRLETLTQDLDGTADDLTLGFTYNRASQIVTNTRSNDAYALVARGLGSIDYETGGLNQLTKIGTATPTHDPRGNLASDGTASYTYSSENLLLTGPNNAALGYDPLMRLHQASATGFSVKRFAYDGTDMIAEYLDTGALFRRYVHGPGMDEPLVWYDGPSGSRVWLHADERGSIAAVSDGNGDKFAINRYDEYGLPHAGNQGRFQYTGQMWLPEVGLYYYKARMYDPKLPRFLQPDPIGYGGGNNLYNYPTDPVNLTDPMGLAPVCTGTRICMSYQDRTGSDSGFGGSEGGESSEWGGGLCGSCSGFGPGYSYAPPKLEYNLDGMLNDDDVTYTGTIQLADASGATTLGISTRVVVRTSFNAAGVLVSIACALTSYACGMSEQRQSLWRVVDGTELAYIRAHGDYGYNASQSGKYFSLSQSGAQNLQRLPSWSNTTLTSITVPQATFDMGTWIPDPGGAGPSLHFSDPQLPIVYRTMSPIRIFERGK